MDVLIFKFNDEIILYEKQLSEAGMSAFNSKDILSYIYIAISIDYK